MSVAALGTIAVFVDVESVLFSGPLLLLIGLYLLIAGVMHRLLWLAVTGALHVGICALFFGLVQLLQWSPREAETPFRILSTVYCWPALVLTLTSLSYLRNPPVPDEVPTYRHE